MTGTTPFLWGASSSPHQTEGNNINSDWWAREGQIPGMERSGDATDSYHRYEEDMRLLADAGLNAYRFGIEWARVEPVPGHFSRAELAHYRRMIDTARSLSLTPVITLHHFSNPRWFAEEGGWLGEQAVKRFTRYVETVSGILGDVPWIATVNEPNMLAMTLTIERQTPSRTGGDAEDSALVDNVRPALPSPDPKIGAVLVEAHHAARAIVRANTDAAVGWTIANRAFAARPGAEARLRQIEYVWEDLYLEAARGDDFVGVQSYSSEWVGPEGIEPHPPHPDNTMVGTAYRPDSLGMAVRHTWKVTDGVPILVTENGIATTDDTRRIAYTKEALRHLFAAADDGLDIRGYLHWSALDNYRWGQWKPTLGLIAVDRETFERRPKPSLAWLGAVARHGRA
ncbi:family 1 glycosylhydrolase [Streptomyces shenzhenensis]|uniref:family 1 glycosylhydrolase n=1 Tax=Streptomyces shenzhenensis TaxID=943815 RepID=UPI0015F06FD5|nr:family 1 glycosylhydrolase [Streptomyces shenzhenensis]